MFKRTDFSTLDPFLSLEHREWGQIIRLSDDVLTIAFAPEVITTFRLLLKDLERCPDRPLVFVGTERSFSREQCNLFLRRLGEMSTFQTVSNFFPTLQSAVMMARKENVLCALIRWLRMVKRPTIMVFQGDVSLTFLGIGLACDYRIASSKTTFYNQGRDHDMPPGGALLYFLPAYVGMGRARSLITRSTETSAHCALKWGLLDEVVALSELDSALQAMTEEISCFSPETLDTIKRSLDHLLPSFDEFFALETKGLDRALRGKPWEKLSSQDSLDASS